jgi:Glyoxalase/Bleomycin resistance protein/Dioxygenase superfamily
MYHSAKVRQGPGSIELPRSRAPAAKANALLYAHFERPDLNQARDYLVDFGLLVAAQGEDELFLRGAGSTPYIYRVSRGGAARFIGFGLSVSSADDLKTLAKAVSRPVEQADGPGGGSVVRLVDPLGVAVSVHHGFAAVAPEPVRAPIPHNAPNQTVRVNGTQRPTLAPPQVTKLGHLVLETLDFDRSARWYMDMLGFIPSDVLCLADGTPVGSFMRLDRGDEPSDHHTLFVATGLESKADHVAFEVVDLDAVEMGQQIMMAKRYRHAWGVGRHLLGSQIFDYWRDPWGQKHEHYADGDLFDAAQPPGYHVLDRAGLYQWGPDLPDDFIDAKLTPRRLLNLLKLAVSDRPRLKKMLALKSSVAKSARPWR